jgi:hypothetical protein
MRWIDQIIPFVWNYDTQHPKSGRTFGTDPSGAESHSGVQKVQLSEQHAELGGGGEV